MKPAIALFSKTFVLMAFLVSIQFSAGRLDVLGKNRASQYFHYIRQFLYFDIIALLLQLDHVTSKFSTEDFEYLLG